MQGTTAKQEAALTVVADLLASAAREPWRLSEDDLADMLGLTQELTRAAEAARVGVVREALERGVAGSAGSTPAASGAVSPADWVARSSPGMQPGDATRVVRVAQACRLPSKKVVADALTAGDVDVRNADVLLREFGRLEPDLNPDAAPTVLEGFVTVATSGGPHEIRTLRKRIIAEFGREGSFQSLQDRARRHRGLSRGWEDDGLRTYLLKLDPEAAAAFEAALDPLSAPQTDAQTKMPDPRTSDQRRADALMEIIARGVQGADGVPLTTKAALVVTMQIQDLVNRTGCGTTPAGDLLAPDTVRKLACDARVIPAVLDTSGEILDVGRSRRLATSAMVRALWVRDGGCTFPGCTRPPTWCDAHHVRHWVDGGPTSVDNLALLCARHHTIVHQRDHTADISGGTVTWHV